MLSVLSSKHIFIKKTKSGLHIRITHNRQRITKTYLEAKGVSQESGTLISGHVRLSSLAVFLLIAFCLLIASTMVFILYDSIVTRNPNGLIGLLFQGLAVITAYIQIQTSLEQGEALIQEIKDTVE